MNTTTDIPPLPMTVAVVKRESAAALHVRGSKPKKQKRKAPRNTLTSTAIYDGLATAYNDADVGALLLVALPNKPTTGNLHKVLLGRGLERGVDYAAFRAKADVLGNNYPPSMRPLVLEKMSDREMYVPERRRIDARRLAYEASERALVDPRLLYAPQKAAVGGPLPTYTDLPAVDPRRLMPDPEEMLGTPIIQGVNPLDTEADLELRGLSLPHLAHEE